MPEQDSPRAFVEHLEELRWRLLRAGIVILMGSVVGFIFAREILERIFLAPLDPDFITYRGLCGMGLGVACSDQMESASIQIINTRLPAQFLLHLKIAFFTGLVLGFPWLVYELWRFVQPGLTARERKLVQQILLGGLILGGVGLMFGYFVLVPFSVRFLYLYQVSPQIVNLISIQSYLGTVMGLMLGSGFLFLLPVVILGLVRAEILTVETLRRIRPYVLVGVLVLAAVLTPPDVFSQLILAGPVYFLYELTIWLAQSRSRSPSSRTSES